MQVLLGPVKYAYPPNDPISIPIAVPMAYREGMGEFPADAWYTDAWKQEQTTPANGLNSEQFGW